MAASRYAHLIDPEQFKLWSQTFSSYDRDGSGDVDQRELGLMFRKLGLAPSDTVSGLSSS